ALNYFRDGAHDVQGTVTASYKVARVQARLGNYDEAKQQMAQCLAAAQETKNDLTIGLWHENLARVWLAENSYESARLEFLNAISYFSKSKNARPQARAELYLGQTEHLLGNLAGAAANYQKALRFFTQTSDYTN